MYGKDDTQTMVYSMRRSQKNREREKLQKKKTRELVTEKRTLYS